MLTSGRALARNAAWNLLGQGAPVLVAIFTIPVLLHTLGAERFGVLTLAWIVVGYMSLFDFGMGRALTGLIAERLGAGKEEAIPGLFWTAFCLMLLLGFGGAAVGIPLADWLAGSVLRLPSELRSESLLAFQLLAISLPFNISTAGLRGTLEAYQRFSLTSILRLIMGISTFLAPVAVLPFSHSLAPVVAALVVTRVIAWVLHLWVCLRVVPGLRQPAIQRAAFQPLLTTGGWMTVTNIAGGLMTVMDRFMLGAMISAAAVAYYATPFDAVTKVLILPAALTGVMFPAFATRYAVDRLTAARLVERTLLAIYLVVFPVALTTVVLARPGLSIWLGEAFASESAQVLQWLALGVLANSLATVPFALLQAAGRADLPARLHLAELPIYLVLLWILVRLDGVNGAAIAWTLRVCLDLLILSVLSRQFVPVQGFAFARIAVISVAALCTAILINDMVQKIAFLVVVLLVYALVAVRSEEVRNLWRLRRGIVGRR